MATRGTAILLKEDMILASVEFNGDMYPHGYSDEFFAEFSTIIPTLPRNGILYIYSIILCLHYNTNSKFCQLHVNNNCERYT